MCTRVLPCFLSTPFAMQYKKQLSGSLKSKPKRWGGCRREEEEGKGSPHFEHRKEVSHTVYIYIICCAC